MKTILSLLLAALLLTGCNDVPQELPTETQRQPQTQATTQPLPKFQEQVLVEDENCLFRVEGIDPEGYTLSVHMENYTDKNLMFSWSEVSVNGYMCDPFWAATVTAGMKAKDKITFSPSELKRLGIGEVTDIAFNLNVYDDDNWRADRLVDEDFDIYPYGEAQAREYPRAPQSTDTVLFDNEACTMLVTGYDPENPWGYTVNVYLENKTDDHLIFAVGDAAVNGFMCDPYWAVTVAEGKRAYSGISWLPEELTAAGVTQVETITLPVRVQDADDLTEDPLVDATFQLTP